MWRHGTFKIYQKDIDQVFINSVFLLVFFANLKKEKTPLFSTHLLLSINYLRKIQFPYLLGHPVPVHIYSIHLLLSINYLREIQFSYLLGHPVPVYIYSIHLLLYNLSQRNLVPIFIGTPCTCIYIFSIHLLLSIIYLREIKLPYLLGHPVHHSLSRSKYFHLLIAPIEGFITLIG